ncbi:MAG: substrate-binding domain-containing protein, partial [Thermoproteota archaeon]|nr:substrate-binding domain-containing protein [Thermoproteota archaeon]
NEGVANAVKGTQNTIGYVELAYALTTKMPYAFLQNQAGKFIEPSISSTEAAVSASAPNLPKGDQPWDSVSVVNAPGADSYPIASFSYLLLYKELSTNPSIDNAKAKALVDFISWAITDGQKFADKLGYVPLPDQVVKLDQDTLKSLTFHGKPIIRGCPWKQIFYLFLGKMINYNMTSIKLTANDIHIFFVFPSHLANHVKRKKQNTNDWLSYVFII